MTGASNARASWLQEAQLSLTNRAMPVCKVIEVWQDFLSEYVDKKFTYICYRRLNRCKDPESCGNQGKVSVSDLSGEFGST